MTQSMFMRIRCLVATRLERFGERVLLILGTLTMTGQIFGGLIIFVIVNIYEMLKDKPICAVDFREYCPVLFEYNLARNSKNKPKLLFSYIKKQTVCKDKIRSLVDGFGQTRTDKQNIVDILNEYNVYKKNGDKNETILIRKQQKHV
ncbi:unnamed protein product, partial [Brachionus calyciflorus]